MKSTLHHIADVLIMTGVLTAGLFALTAFTAGCKKPDPSTAKPPVCVEQDHQVHDRVCHVLWCEPNHASGNGQATLLWCEPSRGPLQ